MKSTLPILAALMLAFLSSQAVAQSQDAQQACEGDVFNLCQDEIPDEDKIVACLRKHWSKVSKECRHVMIDHRKHGRKHNRESANRKGRMGGDARDY